MQALLKDGKASQADVDAAIAQLQQLKLVLTEQQKSYEAATGRASTQNREAFRAAMANTLERRLFYIPSFKIYGSVAGFYGALRKGVPDFVCCCNCASHACCH